MNQSVLTYLLEFVAVFVFYVAFIIGWQVTSKRLARRFARQNTKKHVLTEDDQEWNEYVSRINTYRDEV